MRFLFVALVVLGEITEDEAVAAREYMDALDHPERHSGAVTGDFRTIVSDVRGALAAVRGGVEGD